MKRRRLPSSSSFFFFSASLILLRLSLCHGQQGYLNNHQLSCTANDSTTLGYTCNGASNSCDTYLIIRSQPPYQSPQQLASLLSSNATAISAINGIPVNSSAPTDSQIIVPISCSCSSGYYQHNASYTLKPNDIYFSVANNTYTGLSTCQALIAQNPSHQATNLSPGDIITVPLRCACPTTTQVNQGVRYLLTYSPVFTEDVFTIASRFNVTTNSIIIANYLSDPSNTIFPYTSLLIPLQFPPSKAQTITPPPPPPTPPPPSPPSSEQGGGGGGSDKTGLYIGVAVGAVALLALCGVVCWFFCRHRPSRTQPACYVSCWQSKTSEDQTIEAFLKKHGTLPLKRYNYLEVKRMTESFHHKLGEGGFGSVFKGTLADGHAVAVKLLKDTKLGDGEEFLIEVASIGRTSHINIVSLLGFCFQGSKRALIYDFMPNGSLEKYIYAEDPKTILGWEKLFQIAIGIARGLEYLHRGCNTRIVHFDIKPHNILLDEDFCPKIADFGLAKLGTHKESILSMAGARGTVGFIAPEVFSRNFGVVSTKSDVYSYGMMLLEMAGGRKNVKVIADRTSEIYFPNWIYDHLDQDEWLQYCRVTFDTQEIARKLIIVGLWCIQTRPECRPAMGQVVEMLQGSITDLKIPPKPYLSSPPRSPSTCSMTL